jgi:hypothetical protein
VSGRARGVRERRLEEGMKRLVMIAVTARRGSTVVNQREYKGDDRCHVEVPNGMW